MAQYKMAWKRSSDLVATCSVCRHRGGSEHVPWVVDYWPEFGHEQLHREYRCEDHRPQKGVHLKHEDGRERIYPTWPDPEDLDDPEGWREVVFEET